MADYRQQWDNALLNIQKRLNAEGRGNEFDDWFRPIVFESFDKDACRLLLQVPSSSHSEHIENNYLKILAYELIPIFGKRLSLAYRITVDRQNNQTVLEEQQREMVKARATGNKKTSELQEVDSHLDPRLNFSTHGHTGTVVPVFAYGPGAETFAGVMKNIDLPKKIEELIR